MQVLSVRVGKTINTGNYSSLKLELEASPSDGQTADQLLAEVGEYLDKQAAAATGEPAKPATKSEKAATNKPPLSSDPTSGATATNGKAAPTTTHIDKPATTIIGGDKPPKANKPKAGKAASQASVAKDTKAAEKEFKFALESETLEELAERFNNLRKFAKDVPVSKWDEITASKGKLAELYRKLNTPTSNPETQNQLINAFKAERTYVEENQNTAA